MLHVDHPSMQIICQFATDVVFTMSVICIEI